MWGDPGSDDWYEEQERLERDGPPGGWTLVDALIFAIMLGAALAAVFGWFPEGEK